MSITVNDTINKGEINMSITGNDTINKNESQERITPELNVPRPHDWNIRLRETIYQHIENNKNVNALPNEQKLISKFGVDDIIYTIYKEGDNIKNARNIPANEDVYNIAVYYGDVKANSSIETNDMFGMRYTDEGMYEFYYPTNVKPLTQIELGAYKTPLYNVKDYYGNAEKIDDLFNLIKSPSTQKSINDFLQYLDYSSTLPYTPYGMINNLDRLVDSDNWEDRLTAATEGYGLDVLVNDTNEKVRQAVSYKCNGDLDILNKLINDDNEIVRGNIAAHCNGNIDILNRLANDVDAGVREVVAEYCNGNSDILIKLSEDPEWRVRQTVALNCNGNLDVLKQLINDPSEKVRVNVTCGCNGNPDILNQFVKDPNSEVRQAVALNCYSNPDILNQLVNDPSEEVRIAVAWRSKGNLDILNKLVKDPNVNVQQAALQEAEQYRLTLSELLSEISENGKTTKPKKISVERN